MKFSIIAVVLRSLFGQWLDIEYAMQLNRTDNSNTQISPLLFLITSVSELSNVQESTVYREGFKSSRMVS